MKKRKLELYITGKLMSALMVGRPAIFSTGRPFPADSPEGLFRLFNLRFLCYTVFILLGRKFACEVFLCTFV